MYGKFKILLDESECLGKIVGATLYEDWASVEIVDDDGEKYTLSFRKEK